MRAYDTDPSIDAGIGILQLEAKRKIEVGLLGYATESVKSHF